MDTEANAQERSLSDLSALQFIQFVTTGENLIEYLSESQINDMVFEVDRQYEEDKDSMSDWFTTMQKGLDLARLKKDDKTYPHSKASNIKYPLVTEAALQYNARTYPAICPPGDPVQCAINGDDPDGRKAARGQRVSEYTSFQLKNRMKRWEADEDKGTFLGPLVGTTFKKVWYDPARNTVRSKLCDPGKVILHNGISHISEAPALTEEFELYVHEIESRRRSKWFINETFDGEEQVETNEPQEFIEQVARFDLDGDGYYEPYVVTMHLDTKKIFRVAAAFDARDVRLSQDEQILDIVPHTFYVPRHYLPSIDGGFMGGGLGVLLGDISDSVNSAINQLFDAGHYSTLGGGFIGAKSFRLKGGALRLEPGEYKQVNETGMNIREGVVNVPYPQPSQVMFSLLGMLVDAGKSLASTSNIMTGDAAHANMPVGTVLALIEQGLQVYTASYKRVYLSMKEEFELICRLNERYLDAETYTAFFDEVDEQGMPVQYNPAQDFDLRNMDITPVADPKSVTDMQKMARAQLLKEMSIEGSVDRAAATTRILDAAGIEDTEELIPQASPQEIQMQEMQMTLLLLDIQMKAAQIDKEIADTQKSLASAAKDVASAESEELGRNLNQYLTQLQAMKEQVEIGRARFEGMAGAPGNGSGVQAVGGNVPIGGNGVQGGAMAGQPGGPVPIGPGARPI